MSRVVSAAALSCAVVATVLVPLAQPTAGAPNEVPALTLASTGLQGPGMWPDLNADGRYVEFENSVGDGATRTFVRDLTTGTNSSVPTGGEGYLNGGTLSGDGRLVAFVNELFGNGGGQATIFSVDRQATEGDGLHQVTGTANDLRYQRIDGCAERECFPKLSRDGSTLVAPAALSIDSPDLELSLNDNQPLRNPSTGRFEPLVDFGSLPPRRVVQLTVTAKNTGSTPITFAETGLSLEGDARFRLDPTTTPCVGTVAAGAQCAVPVSFTATDCREDATVQATLRFPGTTPAGQTEVSLIATCARSQISLLPDAPAPQVVSESCSGPSTYAGPLPEPSDPHEGTTSSGVYDLGERTMSGESQLFAARVRNTSSGGMAPISVYAAGCPVRLVVPPGASQACQPGADLPAGGECIAYLETNPTTVGAFAGAIQILGSPDFRIVGFASQKVVLAWRDLSGAGNFAAAGSPRIVSVDGPSGQAINGAEPSVSANGKWVAFTSDNRLGRPSSTLGSKQVYVHDTDAAGDGTGAHGQTVLASVLPSGELGQNGGAPSISGDGNRVAFATEPVPTPTVDDYQVYVRDLQAQKTITASVSPTGEYGGAISTSPALSDDGNTVAYVSASDNLTEAPLDANQRQVYARDVRPDFAGGIGKNELMSTRSDGTGDPEQPSDAPSINADGSVVAFHSSAPLLPEDTDALNDVYVATRASRLAISPTELDFGQVPVETKSAPRVVTVSNSGGSATIGQVQITEPFELASDGCTNTALSAGESCTVGVTFAPTNVGVRYATLTVVPTRGESVDIQLTGEGTSDATMPGETKLGSVDEDPASEIANSAPAISNDGRYVAFLSGSPYDGGLGTVNKNAKGTPAKKSPKERGPKSAVVEALTSEAIHLRDQATGTMERLSLPEHVPMDGPDVSGNAQLVSYVGTTRDTDSTQLLNPNVYAVNRQNPAAPVVRAVTGTPTDLPYQRTDGGCILLGCGPRLSDDGTAVVFAARQDWHSDSLALEVPYQGGEPTTWNVVDFAPTESGSSLYTQQVTVRAEEAVDFVGEPVVDGGDGAFRINGTTCEASLAADQTCTIDLEFVAPRCNETFTGSLRTQGRTPAGQTAVALAGTLPCPPIVRANPPEGKAGPKADPPGCATIPAPATAPVPTVGTETPIGNVQADWVSAEIGDTHYVGLVVTNDGTADTGVTFETPQCGMAFVTPLQPNPDYPTCSEGQSLAAGASCAAYVGFRPETVGAVVANVLLNLFDPNIKVHRFVGNGYRDLALMRRDPSGTGDFAGAGKPAPEIVSVDGDGAPMHALVPVVSGDGRYVAYVSGDPVGRDAADRTLQVYLRDRTAKTTRLVSLLPDGTLDERGIYSVSMSRDGKRIAFDSAMTSEESSAQAQVYVRDLESGRTILASTALDDPGSGGDDDSYDPSLSDDGTTVAFSSFAENLTEQPTTGRGTIFVREIERDFDSDSPRDNEIVSLTNEGRVVDGSSYGAAVNDDGAFVAFGSTGALVPEDTDEETADVYVRRRFAQLVVEPAALDFGTVQVGKKSGAKRVTVRNTGSGPADIGTVTAAAPFAPGAETCAKLRRGKSCTVDVTFAPTSADAVSGAVKLPVSQGYLALPPVGATLAGVGRADPTPGAGFTVTPKELEFGGINLGSQATPKPLVVTNTGAAPLAMTLATASNGNIGDFATDGTPCAVVMPGQTCTVSVQFAPRALGERTGSVTFTASAQDPGATDPQPVAVPLSGVGVGSGGVAAMTVAPARLTFPAGVLGIASAPARVTVRNVGTVALAVAPQTTSVDGDFASASTGCLVLLPGTQCTVDVRFTPRKLGARSGVLEVDAASVDPNVVRPFPVNVALTGSTTAPSLVLDPVVGRPGQITTVRGSNFPPAQQIALSWQLGLGTATAVPDAKGTFAVPMLVFRRDQLGERLLSAAVPSLPAPVVSDPYLVEPLSSQPPGFFFRW